MVSNDNDLFLLKDMQNKIEKEFGTSLWIPVYQENRTEMSNICFWSYLVADNYVDESLKDSAWDLVMGEGYPGCMKEGENVNYYRYGDHEGVEPLVFVRNFIGDNKTYIEISQEFIHFHDLCLDESTNTYFKIDENGNKDTVIKIEDMKVEIKLKYLKQYLAIREMHLALGFEIDQYSNKTLSDMGLNDSNERVELEKIIYDVNLMDETFLGDTNKLALCRISGKKLIKGMNKEESGIWPYSKKKEFEKFIVGIDEDGESIFYTANPKKLRNRFGANPNSPDYLTNIFFKKEVLKKYYSNPSLYSVKDSYITLNGSWSLRVDNHNSDYVIVYLGDLGRDIPYQEQKYWKGFNIVPDGELSRVKHERDFEGNWTDAEISDIKFKGMFERFNQEWTKKYGWALFLELSDEDQHHLASLRIPLNEEQSEFDSQILSLVKIMIDSLNEKELINHTVGAKDENGSISRLNIFLEENGLKNHEKYIKFLRDIQSLRSSGVAHRKGKGYQKILQKFGGDDKNRSEIFDQILKDAIELLRFLENQFLD